MKLDGMMIVPGARQKRILAGGVIASLVLGLAAVTYAGPPLRSWKDGDTLEATELNGNFSAIDTRLAAVEKLPTYLVAESEATENAAFNQDVVYQGVSLDLTPGTWRVEGFATLSTTVAPDAVQISLWDDSNGVEFPQTRSPRQSTVASSGAESCDGVNQYCTEVAATTSSVITVAANTKIRIKGHRNGSSQLWFGASAPPGVLILPPGHRLTALRLK
ncbi:hypothetical protein [Sorangium sp. So ce406]|uniref:hypothetical protein n=1 Tax=Sorangium sp. So ce406 TaxID=3133311 RepID=UPI003F5B8623